MYAKAHGIQRRYFGSLDEALDAAKKIKAKVTQITSKAKEVGGVRDAGTRRAESEEVTGYDVEFSKNDSFTHIRKFKLDSQGKATITIPATLSAQGKYGSLFDVPDTKTTGKLVLQVERGDWEPEFANAEATIASVTQKGGPVKVGGTTCNVDGELEVYGHGSSGPLRAPPALLFKGTFTFKAP